MDVGDDDEWDGEFGLLETTERLFGAECRDRVWARFGGLSIYIPAADTLGPDHPLCDAIGLEQARAVAGELHGVYIKSIPLGPNKGWRHKNEIAASDALNGVLVIETARKLGCTERRVYQIRSELRKAGILPPLDDDNPGYDRTVLLEHALDGLSTKESASILGVTSTEVYKARNKLRSKGLLPPPEAKRQKPLEWK
ncbi:hypothetical protein M9979_13970 [Sphingomonas sp. RP10(2022)]|uniref:Uncharacterized protein n=1 Tax=Sphingomonas liriopis TaxID=2949094 RepID=A0A9X2HR63_9SPHN|nr:hypothetical protein [Sphingomonas liriopis]MCP3735976.1 hypothetical protein [Sphingomonas liriopis]